jgi:hypothetical protein
MKIHESTSSSDSLNESCTKHRRTLSPQINNSLTTDSCPQSPSSFENLAPMKILPSYMHTMTAYHHPTAAFQQHYSGLNF